MWRKVVSKYGVRTLVLLHDLKRKALSTLIEKSEKTMEDARLGSIQMIGALQVMPKASPQGSEEGEQTEVHGVL